jgi:hypothetical protein
LVREIASAAAWSQSNPAKASKRRAIARFLNRWFDRAEESGRGGSSWGSGSIQAAPTSAAPSVANGWLPDAPRLEPVKNPATPEDRAAIFGPLAARLRVAKP